MRGIGVVREYGLIFVLIWIGLHCAVLYCTVLYCLSFVFW